MGQKDKGIFLKKKFYTVVYHFNKIKFWFLFVSQFLCTYIDDYPNKEKKEIIRFIDTNFTIFVFKCFFFWKRKNRSFF